MTWIPVLRAACRRHSSSAQLLTIPITTTSTSRFTTVAAPAVTAAAAPQHPQQQRSRLLSTTAFSSLSLRPLTQPQTNQLLQQQQQRRLASSSAAVAVDEQQPEKSSSGSSKKKKPRRTLESVKDPILVTERAEDRILELLDGPNAKGAMGIRLGVRRRGCNGLSYTLNYAFDTPVENDERAKDIIMTTPTKQIKVFIEPMALFNVVGTKMDWEEDELTSEFTFNNPNSKGECGCGESFTV